MSETGFELWLEFEEWVAKAEDDPEDDFFNMKIRLANGSAYALNVWTYKFLERARRDDLQSGDGLGGKYLLPPDLFVEKLDRELLEGVVSDLIRKDRLKQEWLCPED
jgi:hypothetical protein